MRAAKISDPLKPPPPAAANCLRLALRRCALAFAGVGLFSGVINLLALTGSLYMLQVYDRVLPSRSLPTLVGLTILMVWLYVAFGVLDMLRSRLMLGIGERFDRSVRERAFSALLTLPLRIQRAEAATEPVRDLDQIRAFLTSPGPIALFDLPWLPVYLAFIALLHPLLGLLASAGAVILLALTLLTEARSRAPAQASATSFAARQTFASASRRNAEIIRALGLGGRANRRWDLLNEIAMRDQRRALRVTGGYGAVSRLLRMILQSGTLGLGAYVVIRGEATAGVIIAASIMTSRALAPVEIAIANWRSFVGARQSYARLGAVLRALPAEAERLSLPRPCKSLAVEGVFIGAPGESRAIVQGITFALSAGDGLGVIGPSASGKSTLARALVGAWLLQRGAIRLDGAALEQWSPDALGRHIGYLPQDIELFDGTVTENIARLDDKPSSEMVIEAARAASVHDMILRLSDGYDTRIGEGGARLSAGQRQRIALARALYGDPFLIVLDEPNSNLDAEGDIALSAAIASARERGSIVVVIAHRPGALTAVDKLAVIANGQLQAFGPKEEVLAKVIQPVNSSAAQTNGKPTRLGGPPA